MIDLESFKGATLDDDTFAKLKGGFDDLIAQRDAARQESINGRKGKDQKLTEATKQIDELRNRIETFAERLGIDPDADLSTLPDVMGQAEAAKQFEVRVKRLERENADLKRAAEDATGRVTGMLREQQISKALSGHNFKNPDDVRVLIERRVKAEGDQLLFETDEGKLVPLDEGAQWFAKTRPDYVKPSDAGGSGSGFRTGKAGGGAEKVMQRAQFDTLGPKEQAKAVADGFSITD